MMPPGKVLGFCNMDVHRDVITKGATGWGVDATPDQLSLIISKSLVRDAPLNSQWSVTYGHALGNCIDEFGEVQALGKHMIGILVLLDEQEKEKESKIRDEQEKICMEQMHGSFDGA